MASGTSIFRHKSPSVVLNCFKSDPDTIFQIPVSVKRSITADIVNNKIKPSVKDSLNELFKSIRNRYTPMLYEWLNAHQEFSHIMQAASFSSAAYFKLDEKEKSLRDACMGNLISIATATQIWNCMEFAFFALIQIKANNLLNDKYTARLVYLNDIKLPDAYSHYYDVYKTLDESEHAVRPRNHDHVFVEILDKENNPQFIIDLWQKFVAPHKRPFIGSCSDFIDLLNKRPDGIYVVKTVSYSDVRPLLEVTSTASARGVAYEEPESGQVEGYSGERYARFIR